VAIGAARSLAKYPQALAWFRRLVEIDDDEADEIERRSRVKGFEVARVTQVRMVNGIMRDLTKAMARGESLDEFKARMRRKLKREWGTERPYAIDNIWRTEVQTQYQRARYRQLTQQSVINLRPFWLYDAVMDSRTSTICRTRDGEIRAHDDPWWQSNYPPLHYQCRSGVRALRRSDVERRGGPTRRDIGGDPPLAGFGSTPGGGEITEYTPNLGNVDDVLLREYERKVSR